MGENSDCECIFIIVLCAILSKSALTLLTTRKVASVQGATEEKTALYHCSACACVCVCVCVCVCARATCSMICWNPFRAHKNHWLFGF